MPNSWGVWYYAGAGLILRSGVILRMIRRIHDWEEFAHFQENKGSFQVMVLWNSPCAVTLRSGNFLVSALVSWTLEDNSAEQETCSLHLTAALWQPFNRIYSSAANGSWMEKSTNQERGLHSNPIGAARDNRTTWSSHWGVPWCFQCNAAVVFDVIMKEWPSLLKLTQMCRRFSTAASRARALHEYHHSRMTMPATRKCFKPFLCNSLRTSMGTIKIKDTVTRLIMLAKRKVSNIFFPIRCELVWEPYKSNVISVTRMIMPAKRLCFKHFLSHSLWTCMGAIQVKYYIPSHAW